MSNLTPIDVSYQQVLAKKLELLAHNIAIADKTAAKGRTLTFKEHLNQVEGTEGLSFPVIDTIRKDFSQGPVQMTSNSLDVALSGEGFLCTAAPDGTPLYTRNGNLHRNSLGQLVTVEGYTVFDEGNAALAIPLTTREIKISSQGDVLADGLLVGRLRIVTFPDDQKQNLKEVGESYYISEAPPLPSTTTKVIQGALEKSNVSPVLEITELTNVRHSWNQVHQHFQDEDDRRKRSIDSLGKVVE